MAIGIVSHRRTEESAVNEGARGLFSPGTCSGIPLPGVTGEPAVNLAAEDYDFISSNVIGHAEVRPSNRHRSGGWGDISPHIGCGIEFPYIVQMRSKHIISTRRNIRVASAEENHFVTHWIVDHPMSGARTGR